MVNRIRRLLTVMLAAGLLGGLAWGQDQAGAQTSEEATTAEAGQATTAPAPSGSVLRLARGLASDNITVLIGRAIVVESTQPFIEVSVANPDVADVSPLSDRSIYIFGKNRGATSLTLLGENGQLITNVTVRVIPDLSELKAHLGQVFPNEPVEARLSGGGVVLSGVVSGAEKVERIMRLANSYVGDSAINMMTVGGTQQVMLKVRVAEMSRSAAKELGIDLNISGSGSDVGGGLLSGSATKPTIGLGTASPAGGGTFSAPNAFGLLGVIADLGDIGIGLALTTLEQKGFSRTLAEPNLVALSGQQAKFLAGQDVPIPQVGEDGELEVEFKEVGVALNFTPVVLDEDLINLAVSAEVSAIDQTAEGIPVSATQGNVIPIFTVRRATTTVELRDGESFAIAGLLQDNFTDAIDQFPWLGDLPVLGALFRSTNYSRGETELVIIVTTHLVTPVTDAELSMPIDHVRIPNEFELFLMGHTEAGGAPGMVQSQGFDGEFGYVVE